MKIANGVGIRNRGRGSAVALTCLTLTFLRRNDVNYLRIPTPSFEELGPQLESTAVTYRVHTPCLPAKQKQK